MESTQYEREVRAARNQALFRAVNAKIKEMSEAFADLTETFVIACECADRSCAEMLSISHAEYEQIRANPRHFAVRPGHVLPDVEAVVRETDEYIVVEKVAAAAEAAETLDQRS
jgi:hypothetical protein